MKIFQAIIIPFLGLAMVSSSLQAHQGSEEELNKTTVLELMTRLSSGELEDLTRLISQAGTFTPENARKMQTLRRSYFPDLQYEVEEIIAEGNRVVVWYTVTGHHTAGDEKHPPTQNALEIPEVALFVLEAGKVLDRLLMTDMRTLEKVMADSRK